MTHVLVVGTNGEIRHLNDPVIRELKLGEVVAIKRNGVVDVFDELPTAVQLAIVNNYGSLTIADHLKAYPHHALLWWVWLTATRQVAGPFTTRESAIDYEVATLKLLGLPYG